MSAYLTQPLKRAARINGTGIATIDGDRKRSWRDVQDRVSRMAGALRGLGVGPGQRVAILASGCDKYLELHFAIPWAGACIVPVNTRLAPAEIAHILRDSGAVVLCTDESQSAILDQLGEVLEGMKGVISLSGAAVEGQYDYESLISASEPVEDAGRCGQEMAGIFYTGGSSGRPKGVVLSYDNLVTNAMNSLALVGYGRNSVYLHAAPMFHMTDGMATFSVTMAAGTHVFMPSFNPRDSLDLIAKHRVTHTCIVPTMVEMMVKVAEAEPVDASSLKVLQYGAAPMPDATLERMTRLWPDLQYLHGWGMTELSPLGTMLPEGFRTPAEAGDRMKSIGVPVLNEEIIIADEAGQEVPSGTVGEILVRGPMVMQGYWNLPEETAKALKNGWMHTGDAAWMDEDGFIFIVDRIKDMIITGGENVYSLEVENVLGQHPAVSQVAVIGLPDPLWGERVHAVIVPKGEAPTEEELAALCRDQIAGYKCPRSFEYRDALPLTGAGKVSKKTMRDEFMAREGAEA